MRSAFLLSLVLAVTVSAAPAELAPGEVRYLVTLRPGATAAGVAAAGARIEAQNGSTLTVVVPAVFTRWLADVPEVVSVVEIGSDAVEASRPAAAPSRQLTVDAAAQHGPTGSRKLTPQNANPLWASGQYVYDGGGNILAMGVAGGTLNTYGKKSTFTYDAASRLTAATVGWSQSESDLQETYTYDGFGNLTKHERTSPDVITYPPTANPPRLPDPATNRETDAGSVYDEAGNETNVSGSIALTYDAFNQATSKTQGAATPITYIYDVNEERIGIQQGGITHWTIRDFDNKPLMQFDSSVALGDTHWSATQWTWVESFVWSAGRMLAAERPNKRLHYHLDHLGSPRVVSEVLIADNSKSFTTVEYAPYGEEITKSGGEPLKFTGHERDYDPGNPANDGYLDYMHARYYDPRFGRFLAVDPVLSVKRALQYPQRWDRYAYVENNPILNTDPTGQEMAVSGGTSFVKPPPNDPVERGVKRLAIGAAVVAGAVAGVSEAGAIAEGLHVAAGAALTWALTPGNLSNAGQALLQLVVPGPGGEMPAIPTLNAGSAREMAGEAMNVTNKMMGTASQKVAMFEALAGQIESASKGAWSATKMAGPQGSTVFVGRAGEALVINSKGQVFRGALGKGVDVVKGVLQVTWSSLRPL